MWLDGGALRQVLSNLLGNAVKFTDVGHVEVTLSLQLDQDSAHLWLAVRDTGIGIPADQHERVFKAFAQAHDEHSRQMGGAGLGLSICQDLVRGMGGTVQLGSAPGAGSRFDVRLPVVLEATSLCAGEHPLAGRTLLLVEDHALNRTVVCRQLEALGASVSSCADGASALQSQAAEPCGVVLLDCVLGDMSGYELAVQLRQLERRHGRTPAVLVALSANDSPSHAERCLACGMDAVLCKPLEIRSLLRALRVEEPASAPLLAAGSGAVIDPIWVEILQSLQQEQNALHDALRDQSGTALRHHAHRLAGVLQMLGQPDLAAIAGDLHELDLEQPTDWREAERLLGYLRPAVAALVGGAITSTAGDSAATARAPGTR